MKKQQLLALAGERYNEDQCAELVSAIDLRLKNMLVKNAIVASHTSRTRFAVASILVDWGMDIDTVIAGVLHDTIEDTQTTFEELEKYFGRDVAFRRWRHQSQPRPRRYEDLSHYLPETRQPHQTAHRRRLRTYVSSSSNSLTACTICRHLRHIPENHNPKLHARRYFAPIADRLNMGEPVSSRFRVFVPRTQAVHAAATRD